MGFTGSCRISFELTGLRYFRLLDPPYVYFGIPVQVAEVVGRNNRNLSGTKITDTVSGSLPRQIQKLDVSHTAAGDLLLYDLRKFRSLHRLNVTGTKVTDQGIEAFQKAVPGCKVIK